MSFYARTQARNDCHTSLHFKSSSAFFEGDFEGDNSELLFWREKVDVSFSSVGVSRQYRYAVLTLMKYFIGKLPRFLQSLSRPKYCNTAEHWCHAQLVRNQIRALQVCGAGSDPVWWPDSLNVFMMGYFLPRERETQDETWLFTQLVYKSHITTVPHPPCPLMGLSEGIFGISQPTRSLFNRPWHLAFMMNSPPSMAEWHKSWAMPTHPGFASF